MILPEHRDATERRAVRSKYARATILNFARSPRLLHREHFGRRGVPYHGYHASNGGALLYERR